MSRHRNNKASSSQHILLRKKHKKVRKSKKTNNKQMERDNFAAFSRMPPRRKAWKLQTNQHGIRFRPPVCLYSRHRERTNRNLAHRHATKEKQRMRIDRIAIAKTRIRPRAAGTRRRTQAAGGRPAVPAPGVYVYRGDR